MYFTELCVAAGVVEVVRAPLAEMGHQLLANVSKTN
jgi:hypothetical protein